MHFFCGKFLLILIYPLKALGLTFFTAPLRRAVSKEYIVSEHVREEGGEGGKTLVFIMVGKT